MNAQLSHASDASSVFLYSWYGLIKTQRVPTRTTNSVVDLFKQYGELLSKNKRCPYDVGDVGLVTCPKWDWCFVLEGQIIGAACKMLGGISLWQLCSSREIYEVPTSHLPTRGPWASIFSGFFIWGWRQSTGADGASYIKNIKGWFVCVSARVAVSRRSCLWNVWSIMVLIAKPAKLWGENDSHIGSLVRDVSPCAVLYNFVDR